MIVYNYFKKYLISEIKPATEELDLSFNTVAKSVDFLLEKGVLKTENAQSRHRTFVHRGLNDVFI